jgi:hypothetical protein
MDFTVPKMSTVPPPPARPLPRRPGSILRKEAKSASLPIHVSRDALQVGSRDKARVSFDDSVQYGGSRRNSRLSEKLQERKWATERALAWVWNDGEIPRSPESSTLQDLSKQWLLVDKPNESDSNSRSPVVGDSEFSFREYDEFEAWTNPAFEHLNESSSCQGDDKPGERTTTKSTNSLQNNPITLIL